MKKKNKFYNQTQNKKQNLASAGKKLIGIVKRHPDGYGFFIPEDDGLPDYYVAKHSMNGVMTNDKVEVSIRRDGDRQRAEVGKIIERAVKQVFGVLKKLNSSQGVLTDESFAWGEDLKVSWSPGLQVKDHDWVSAKITSYPDSLRGFQGQVEKILGDISDPLNDNQRVLATQSIPHVFSRKTLEEAEALPEDVQPSDRERRKDLTGKKLITIDGKTAKDFDDAVYVEKMNTGFRLWVAIADVSHYVKPGSAIDKDAYDRGTSTYFPNFVSPMLPEKLSNELCSLKPHVLRLSLVAEMDFNFQGEMQKSDFYEAVIKSHARVTYGEAQEVLDGEVPEKLQHVKDEIKRAGELAHILMEKRYQEGSLSLEIPESVIEVNEAGQPVDLIKSERLFSHKLIEELMLAANVAVARHFKNKSIPAIYRIHEPPKEEALSTLTRFLQNFGYTKNLRNHQLQSSITAALDDFRGQPQESIISSLVLRSMNQAKYSANNVGHFGLGFSDYTHFTSPIRRYPDLIVHRLLKATIGVKNYAKIPKDELDTAGVFLSACEQRSVKAERLVQSIKKARFLSRHIGEEFDGLISSVTKFGLFVTLRRFDVDGLVRVESLGGEHFEYDEEQLRLKGQRSGFSYGIGDAITIQVAAADYQTGRVDFVLPKVEKLKNAVEKKVQPHQKRRPSEKDSVSVREIRVSGHYRKDQSKERHGSRKANSRKHK